MCELLINKTKFNICKNSSHRIRIYRQYKLIVEKITVYI